jgi:hypothetical protein
MSLPEISRRCVSCGAAVRAGARFCQQCGKSVPDDAALVDAAVVPPVEPETPERNAEPPLDAAPPTGEVYAAASESESPTNRAADASMSKTEPAALEAESSVRSGDGARGGATDTGEWRAASETGVGVAGVPYAPAAPPQQSAFQQQGQPADDAAVEERRGPGARVREGTRARVENTRARVERVRDDARVALEETPDDSGLRFVLVTAFLFALFLLFLFLSVTVLR